MGFKAEETSEIGFQRILGPWGACIAGVFLRLDVSVFLRLPQATQSERCLEVEEFPREVVIQVRYRFQY
jgi:hypothetical protein